MAFLRKNRRGFQVVGLVVALAVVGVLATVAINGASRATANPMATITGKVLGPTGSPISFTCGGMMSEVPPGGTPPPGGSTTCGIWVMAMGGPGTPGSGANASTTDGSFSISVENGRSYQIQFQGPPDQIGQYTFETKFVEIGVNETTKDIGTITATEKQGSISGIVRDATTLVGIPNVRVSAFPMNFGGPGGEGGGPQGPMMPSEATTGADGSFTIRVNQGFYGVGLQSGPDSQYVYSGPPIEARCESDDCNVTGIVIGVTQADATITGSIVDTAGNPVFFPGGVGARPVGSTGFQEYHSPIMPVGTPPNQTSTYTLKVPSSTPQYTLSVQTPPDVNYSVQGDVTVTVTQNGTTTQNLTVAADTSSIYGKLVTDSGFAMASCKTDGKDADKFGGKSRYGEVFAHNDKKGVFRNTEIKEDCTYTMTLGAGEYFFGYHINAKGIVNRPLPPEPITVAANTDVEKNITVTAGDATITGQVFAANGSPMGNVWIDAGNEEEVKKEFKTGGQESGEGPKAGEFRGPGGAKDPEEMMKFCSQKKNEKECKDFKLPPGSEGPGGCTNMLECSQYCTKNPKICQEFDKGGSDQPQGQSTVLGRRSGLAQYMTRGRAHVLAEDVKKEFKGPEFNENIIHMGTRAGPDGKFSLTVLSGHKYMVRANLPPDKNTGTAMPPKAVPVDMTTVKTANIVLQFKEAFGTMTGTVKMPDGSAADRCFVHGWGDGGEEIGAPCNQDGTYSVGYSDKAKMHIAADSFDGRTPYASKEVIVAISGQKTMTQNFQLEERGFSVPSPVSQSVEEDEQSTITLDDGTQISIPSGALGTDGPYTVSVTPTVDLKSTEDNDPIGAGYSMNATDVNGQTVSEFASNVTITMKYDGDYVEKELGLNENLLEPTYVDDTTGAYQDVTNATKDADEDTITAVVDHFSDWTVVSPSGVKLKSVSVASSGSKKTKISIDDGAKTITLPDKKDNWNVGTADFGEKAGQYIVVSNKTSTVATKYRGKVLLYATNGKLKKTWTPFKGFAGGLNQVVADLVAKSGSASDGTDDVAVAPATTGPAQAAIFNIKQNKKSKVTTGTGTGTTMVNTAELYAAGSANLTTLFNGTTAKAWKMSKGKYKEGADASGSLTVKNGKAEKATTTPKVKKVAGRCSQSDSSTLTIKGKGFGAISEPIMLWNATSALAVQSFTDTKIVILVNPSAIDINATNTLTIVNSDGQAGVGIVSCGT